MQSSNRAYLYGTFRESWEAAVKGQETTLDQKRKMQLAMTHGVACAAGAVDLVHAAAGTSSMHAFVSASRHESAGRLMLELESG